MTVTVVGKQNPEETLAVIEKYFGKMEGKDDCRPMAIREPLHRGERRVDLVFDANPFLLIGWNKPTYPSRDDYVCDIIAGVLADGKTSRLYRSLVLGKKIAASVDAYNGFPGSRYDNLFVIAVSPMDPHAPQEVEAAVYEEISRLRNDVSPEEINRVINRTESSLVFDLDSNKGLSHALSYYQTVFGDWKYLVRYLEDIKGVAAEDVAAVLDRYFTKENRTVGTLLKKEKKMEPVR
jgi:predicted Zn-dependent peptidase